MHYVVIKGECSRHDVLHDKLNELNSNYVGSVLQRELYTWKLNAWLEQLLILQTHNAFFPRDWWHLYITEREKKSGSHQRIEPRASGCTYLTLSLLYCMTKVCVWSKCWQSCSIYSRAHKNYHASARGGRACNFLKSWTGQNFWTVLKIEHPV